MVGSVVRSVVGIGVASVGVVVAPADARVVPRMGLRWWVGRGGGGGSRSSNAVGITVWLRRDFSPLVVLCFLLYILVLFLSNCLLYTSPSPRDGLLSRMPSSA